MRLRGWAGVAAVVLLWAGTGRAQTPPAAAPEAKPGVATDVAATDVSGWKLVWSSEFNGAAGTAPAAAKWSYERGNRNGWGNRELETYCAPAGSTTPCSPAKPNIEEDGQGHLVIRAVRAADGSWTSGRMKTAGLYTVAYGRIEARMQLPLGAGLWPAFWMLGTNHAGWPAEGELDIMEHVPQLGPSTIQSSVHAADFHGGDSLHGKFTLPAGETIANGFHTYGVIWTPDQIQYYVDSPAHVFVTITRPTPTSSWPFDQGASDPFGILLNLAVGGNWPGPPDAATPGVATMLVDYVRVYQPAIPAAAAPPSR